MIVQNRTTFLRCRSNCYFIEQYWVHPEWDPRDVSSVEVGAMEVEEGTMLRRLEVASSLDLLPLRVGPPIATIGFPGELQGGFLSDRRRGACPCE